MICSKYHSTHKIFHYLFALPAADFSGNSVSSIIGETFDAPSAVASFGAHDDDLFGSDVAGGFRLKRLCGVAIFPLNIT